MTPSIRPARPTEAAEVARLFNGLNSLDGPLATPMTGDDVTRDLLGPDPWAVLRVAECDGALVGFVTASRFHDSRSRGGALLLGDLWVEPPHRRRGIARALVAELASLARELGAGLIWWGVDEGDEEAMRFYAAIGAEDGGRFAGLSLQGEALERLRP